MVEALKEVSFEVGAGELVSIAGPSGSGKSTLLNMMGMLDTPTSGRITIGGTDVSSLSENQKTVMRNREIGFIFQFANLIPELNALENVMLPGMVSGENNAVLRERALGLLKQVGLASKARSGATQLSGGEMQRVAVARSLVNNPSLVLADEPTGNLDTKNSGEIIDLMKDLNRKNNQTFVIVSHDPSVVREMNKIIRIQDGLIDSVGNSSEYLRAEGSYSRDQPESQLALNTVRLTELEEENTLLRHRLDKMESETRELKEVVGKQNAKRKAKSS